MKKLESVIFNTDDLVAVRSVFGHVLSGTSLADTIESMIRERSLNPLRMYLHLRFGLYGDER